MSVKYNCPKCDSELEGEGFGDRVYCEKCDLTYETDWEYDEGYDYGCWLIEEPIKGKHLENE